MFSYRLKQLREDYGFTQSQLAKKLNLTQSTIAYYENNQKMPTLENAKLIAEILNTSLDYLLDVSINQVSENEAGYAMARDRLIRDIDSLSPESKKDLEGFIDFLKFRDRHSNSNCKISDIDK